MRLSTVQINKESSKSSPLIYSNKIYADECAIYAILYSGNKTPRVYFKVSVHPEYPTLILLKPTKTRTKYFGTHVGNKILFNYAFSKLAIFKLSGFFEKNSDGIFSLTRPDMQFSGMPTITVEIT